MTCSKPPALSDELLNAALDGLADEAVATHLETCAFCRGRLEAMQAFDRRLQAKLYRWDCPPLQTLGDYELDLLPPDEVRTIKAHVQMCPRCQAELNTLRDMLAEPDERAVDPQTLPPESEQVGHPRRPQARNILVAEPSRDVAAYASRGADALRRPSRGGDEADIDLASHPLYEVKGITIFMEVQEGTNHQLTLIGQLILDAYTDWIDALVEVRQDGIVKTVSAVDSTAGFRCRLVNREPIDVTITSRKGTVLLLRRVQPWRA